MTTARADDLSRGPSDVLGIVAGTAALRMSVLHEPPFEDISRSEARMQGVRLMAQVRAFVAGSDLAGLVDLDLLTRRARITLALDRISATIQSARLALTTPAEVADALRMWTSVD